MRHLFIVFLLFSIPLGLSAQKKKKKKKVVPMETAVDSISYALGMDIARNLQRVEVPIDHEWFYQGFLEAYGEDSTSLTDEQVAYWVNKYQADAKAAQTLKQKEMTAHIKEEGEAFLSENANSEGVSVTASGLQYKVLREGEGDPPRASSTVKVHYEGRLLDGTVFDSSYKRGQPIEFALNRVIPGWTEGVQLMTPGSKYRFFIPYKLAYGERGAPPSIPGFATLIFDVELLEIK